MTTVYALSILLAFALPGYVWLGWLLYEARAAVTAVEAVVFRQSARGSEQTRRYVAEVAYLNDRNAAVTKERDDALANLEFVLNDYDVAGVLDMHKLLRDAAPIIRHHLPFKAVR